MLRRLLLASFVAVALGSVPALATDRVIVRFNLGLPALQNDCALLGCTIAETLDGATGSLFLVTAPDTLDLNQLLSAILNLTGVVDAEVDQIANVSGSATSIPPALNDNKAVQYYGATVIDGYVHQPATSIVRLSNMRDAFPNATGAGIVAVIDTGVDPNHPALKGVLLPGYDFTRNRAGADETADVTLGQTPVVNGVPPTWVSGSGDSSDLDQSTAAVVDQSTAAVVDGNPQYGDFGHGTMVAGLVHLVAPTARILPLKAFKADGTGYTSDILRAIYYAIASNTNVMNMSFNLTSYSTELAIAVHTATLTGIVSVAAAGNSGEKTLVYPAALVDVIGVASTNNHDQLSTFSNYGPQLVWVAAPGEGVITTYPFGTWAAAWGTSFSTPLTSGLASVLMSINAPCGPYSAAQSIAHAKWINYNLGHGRIDLYQATEAWNSGY
ncbi:MAG TPA: S8 family serine peptidase [Bryobacteraceae bacterium]|jgi:hypothetical protein|nr:S8 family serine peptidase [Bryobacteraceae bacterium]